jgi:TonB family protein
MKLLIFLAALLLSSFGSASASKCPGAAGAEATSRHRKTAEEKATAAFEMTRAAVPEWQISNSPEWALDGSNPPFRYDDDKLNLLSSDYCHTSKFCLTVERTQVKSKRKLSPKKRLEMALKEWIGDRNKSAAILHNAFNVTQKLPWTHEEFPGLQITAQQSSEVRSFLFANEKFAYRITAHFDAPDTATYSTWFKNWISFVDEFETVGFELNSASTVADCFSEQDEENEVSANIQSDILANIYEGKKFSCPRPFEVHQLVHPPQLVRRGITGKVSVGIKINAQKEPLQAWIVQSSGYELMDANAVWGACGMRYSNWKTDADFVVPLSFNLEDN